MDITEVRVKLVPPGNDKLRAFCSITIDNCFVVRDLKVIEGTKGAFVAMPSRKLTNRCSRCGGKNHHRASYCNDCGGRLPVDRGMRGVGVRPKLHADIAHPINSECREVIQQSVLDVYRAEVDRAKQPGYQPMAFDDFDVAILDDDLGHEAPVRREGLPAPAGRDEPVEEAATESVAGPFSAADRGFGGRRGPTRDRKPLPAAERAERTELEHGDLDVHTLRESGTAGRDREPEGEEERHTGGLVREVRPPRRGDRRTALEPFEAPPRPSPPSLPTERPRRRPRFIDESDTEPEDNFGAGLFS